MNDGLRRLSSYQNTSSFWHARFDEALKQLRRESLELRAGQSDKLNDISRTLDELASRLKRVSSAPRTGLKVFFPDDIEGIESQMTRLSLCKAAAVKENRILRSLSFDSRPVRHSSITKASARTFEWAFKEADPQRDTESSSIVTGNFLSWLMAGDGVFWVTGKPGSGKSTFMKFIADHPTTLTMLTRWAHPKRPVLASHYFWSAGTPIQKSQQGLLQTLLHEIFRQIPDIIEPVCGERWSKTVDWLKYEPWQVPELQNVLQRIADRQDIPVKFCFFLDGLDEFAGEHVDFCHSLRELAQSPNIKLCLSSRSWNVFEDSFGSAGTDRKLYIHELTHDDIRYYAELRLQQHPRWKSFCDEAPNASWLLDEITERAAGVFLWVFLVTRELRSGLSEYDSVSDIRRRLECIPVDLEEFFKRILESVETFYLPKMATTLQIALAATEPVDVAVYGLHELEYEDQDYAFKIPLWRLGNSGATAPRELTGRRLKARCRGLLEVNRHSNRVEFLHRTVMDFLRTAEMSTFLTDKAPPGFEARLSLARALTAYVKVSDFRKPVDSTEFNFYTEYHLKSALKEVLAQVKELRGEAAKAAYLLLDELDRCIPEINSIGHANLMNTVSSSNSIATYFRKEVVDANLVQYLARTLPGQPDYFANFEVSALSHVIESLIESFDNSGGSRHYSAFPSADLWPQVGMIRCLLTNGCNPNEHCMNRGPKKTPWERLVNYATVYADNQGDTPGSNRAILYEIMTLMLQHGADP